MQIELGKTYNLNNGKTVAIDGMRGDDPNSIDKYGYGPFYSNEMGLFHIDGRFAAGSNPELDIVSEWVDDSVVEYNMKLDEYQAEDLQRAIAGDADALWHAFTWRNTPQGVKYWRDQANNDRPLDIETLKEIQRQCVTGQVGTLAELGVKAGDVVECVEKGNDVFIYPVNPIHKVQMFGAYLGWCGMGVNKCNGKFRIISRADTTDTTPKTWGEMTDAEKGALLLAEHEGKVIEIGGGDCWFAFDKSSKPNFQRMSRYRIKPEPKRETVELWWRKVEGDDCSEGRFGTIDLVDGEPDCGSVKMEAV